MGFAPKGTHDLNLVLAEMKLMAEELTHGTQLTAIRNAIVHSICADEPCLRPAVLPASCQQITAEIAQAIPSKQAPTSLGSASLTPAPQEKLNEEELQAFLQEHDLLATRNMDGIEWRVKKLKYALEKNAKLINPSLTAEKQKMLKLMLL